MADTHEISGTHKINHLFDHLPGFRTDEAGLPEINGRPAGDYTLPGRADVADMAIEPSAADLQFVVNGAKRVMATLPPEEAQGYKASVDERFFGQAA